MVQYGTFICHSTGEIISSYHLCDGISTCYHGDDELYCDGIHNKLTVEMVSFLFFKCSNGSFLSYSKVKNNITDCQHGDDENSTVHIHFVSKLAPSVPDTEHCISQLFISNVKIHIASLTNMYATKHWTVHTVKMSMRVYA